jgi:hypothetical protein
MLSYKTKNKIYASIKYSFVFVEHSLYWHLKSLIAVLYCGKGRPTSCPLTAILYTIINQKQRHQDGNRRTYSDPWEAPVIPYAKHGY